MKTARSRLADLHAEEILEAVRDEVFHEGQVEWVEREGKNLLQTGYELRSKPFFAVIERTSIANSLSSGNRRLRRIVDYTGIGVFVGRQMREYGGSTYSMVIENDEAYSDAFPKAQEYLAEGKLWHIPNLFQASRRRQSFDFPVTEGRLCEILTQVVKERQAKGNLPDLRRALGDSVVAGLPPIFASRGYMEEKEINAWLAQRVKDQKPKESGFRLPTFLSR